MNFYDNAERRQRNDRERERERKWKKWQATPNSIHSKYDATIASGRVKTHLKILLIIPSLGVYPSELVVTVFCFYFCNCSSININLQNSHKIWNTMLFMFSVCMFMPNTCVCALNVMTFFLHRLFTLFLSCHYVFFSVHNFKIEHTTEKKTTTRAAVIAATAKWKINKWTFTSTSCSCLSGVVCFCTSSLHLITYFILCVAKGTIRKKSNNKIEKAKQNITELQCYGKIYRYKSHCKTLNLYFIPFVFWRRRLRFILSFSFLWSHYHYTYVGNMSLAQPYTSSVRKMQKRAQWIFKLKPNRWMAADDNANMYTHTNIHTHIFG